jgi:hypothetical protein
LQVELRAFNCTRVTPLRVCAGDEVSACAATSNSIAVRCTFSIALSEGPRLVNRIDFTFLAVSGRLSINAPASLLTR